MVRLNKIYTKTGDDGTTALGSGHRVTKYDLRVQAYGTVDEVNAQLGVCRLHTSDHETIHSDILRIQNDLFDLGADLATPDTGEDLGYEPLRVTPSQTDWLEKRIDTLNGDLQPLKSFILPGGSAAAAQLHVARTLCRRAERCIVELKDQAHEPVSEAVAIYMNRLSDYLFVAGRIVNENGAADVLWVPGKNR